MCFKRQIDFDKIDVYTIVNKVPSIIDGIRTDTFNAF